MNHSLPEFIDRVQINGLTMLKIIEHRHDSAANFITGQLLGLDVGDTLDISNCFPFPSDEGWTTPDEEDFFQLDMMRCLHAINIDNNLVGWYQSTELSYQTVEVLETFLGYHKALIHCICLVYDPTVAACGMFPFKAVKVKQPFLNEFYSKKMDSKIKAECIQEARFSWGDIFDEIPVYVQNSMLLRTTMSLIRDSTMIPDKAPNQLDLQIENTLLKNMAEMVEAMDDFVREQNHLSTYFRQIQKQRQLIANRDLKLRLENDARKLVGKELLPEQETIMSRSLLDTKYLELLLLSHRIHSVCDLIPSLSAQALQRTKVLQLAAHTFETDE